MQIYSPIYRFLVRGAAYLFIFGAVSATFTSTTHAMDSHESNEAYWFRKGVESYQKKDFDAASQSFDEGLKYAKELKPHFKFYMAEVAVEQKRNDKAMPLFTEALRITSSPRLRMQTLQKIMELNLEAKEYEKALQVFNANKKYLRSRADRPLMNHYQGRIYKYLKNPKKMCESVKNLYTKYPEFSLVSHWSQDLEKNEFEGHPTGCTTNIDDFKERVRNLLWAGLDQKALAEVQVVRARYKDSNPALGDALLAQFYVQEGEIGKAYELLVPYYESKKKDVKFLNQFAVAAARKNDGDMAYRVYRELHNIAPKSKEGRKALFQAAFLSYQFNNYDRASATFKEFIQKYPQSGLKKDAQWHLAWLEYLKGDYAKAKKEFKAQLKNKSTLERTQYWLAMTYLREGDYVNARRLFTELSKDQFKSYYAMAAAFRLNSMPAANTPQKLLASISSPFVVARSMFNFPKSHDDEKYVEVAEEEESEATFTAVDVDPRDADETVDTEGFEEKGDEALTLAQGDVIGRVKLFKALGLDDWARDEIQRFDRRKKDRRFLEEVWTEFSDLHLYNYSSDLARSVFSNQKNSKDIDEVRNFYVKTYPRAYEDSVSKSAKSFDIKPEFIWAIMRTESQYKEEAISPVGALGLMQVMPLTGRKMAEKIGLKDFEPPQLLQPDVSVQIGSSYLQRLMKKFSQEIPLASAAYNAGPHRVKMWSASIGDRDWDEFIDHIPFVETRNYVKRVVLSYQIYYWSQNKVLDKNLDLSKKSAFKMTEPVPLKETWEDI